MYRKLSILVVLLGACAYKPWSTHSTIAGKPASPLHADPDQALLVVLVNSPQGSGNGGYTAFERDGSELNPVAQVDEKLAAWTVRPMKPGHHEVYVRTWTSAFCSRHDADFVAGKIYVLALNPTAAEHIGLVGSNGNLIPRAGFQPIEGGPLAFHPYVAMDDTAARNELASHRSQVNECIKSGDKNHPAIPAYSAGQDEIDFTVPR
jgi:hypothetical protein